MKKTNHKIKLNIILFSLFLALFLLFLGGCQTKEYVEISFLRDADHHCRLEGTITKKVVKGKPIGKQITPPHIKYDRGYKAGDDIWQPTFSSQLVANEDLVFVATTTIDPTINDFLFEVRYLKQVGSKLVEIAASDKYYGSIGQRRSIDIASIPGYKTSQDQTIDIEFTSQIKQGYDVIFTIDESQKFKYEIQYYEEDTNIQIKQPKIGEGNVEEIISDTSKDNDVPGYFSTKPNQTINLMLTSDTTKNIIKHYYKRDNNAWTTISFETDIDHHSKFHPNAKTTFNVLKGVPFLQQNITPPEIIYDMGYKKGQTVWDNNYSGNLQIKSHKTFRAVVEKDVSQWMTISFVKSTGVESLNGQLSFEVLRNLPLNKQNVTEPVIVYKLGFKRGTTKWLPTSFSLQNAYNESVLTITPNVIEIEKVKLTFNADVNSRVNNSSSAIVYVYKGISLQDQNFIEPAISYNPGYRVSSLGKWDKVISVSYSSDTTFTALTEKDPDQWTKVIFKNDKYNIVSLSGKTDYDVIKNIPLNNQGIIYPSFQEYKGINIKWNVVDLSITIQAELTIYLIVAVNSEVLDFSENFESSFVPGSGYIITKAKPTLVNYVGLAVPKFYNSQKVIGIDDGAFNNLKQLKLFQISNKITKLSAKSFYLNPFLLLEDYEESDDKKFKLVDDILYSFDLSTLIICPTDLARENINISPSTTKVLKLAFNKISNTDNIFFYAHNITFEEDAVIISNPTQSTLKIHLYNQLDLSVFLPNWTNCKQSNILLDLE